MASHWGSSWGASWGNSWGAIAVETPAVDRGYYGIPIYPPKVAEKPKRRPVSAVARGVIVTLYPTFEPGTATGGGKARGAEFASAGAVLDAGVARGAAMAHGAQMEIAAALVAGVARGAAIAPGANMRPHGELMAEDEALLLLS